ncbi:MAG: phosphatase domain-containing protein [Rhodothermales bacterium]
MPHLLARLLTPIEETLDRAKLGLKWKYGLWRDLRVRPYLGYGTPDEVRLTGRVLDDKRIETGPSDSVWTNVRRTLRRVESDEVPGATVRLTDGDRTMEAETDGDGYFTFNFAPDAPARPWHEVTLDLAAPEPDDPAGARATGRILLPPTDADFAVVSDLDDTIVKTGATNKLSYARAVLLNNATSRLPFPGVGAFYRALRGGPDGGGGNPFFYVSSSPWNLFGQFHGFLRHRDIPEGPIFLKDFGIDEDKFIKGGHRSHKLDYLRTLLDAYPDLGFVLVGDSGQEDAEIYLRLAHERPGRLRAVYIRDVSDRDRDRKVQQIADELAGLGVPMCATEHSVDAARHAAEVGLIPADAVERVAAEADEEAQRETGLWDRLLG